METCKEKLLHVLENMHIVAIPSSDNNQINAVYLHRLAHMQLTMIDRPRRGRAMEKERKREKERERERERNFLIY